MANDNGITIGQLTEQLNQKMDLPTGVSQDTMDYVVEWKTPTEDDPTWYRKYKSGWLECGGFTGTASTTRGQTISINFPKSFADTNYTFIAVDGENSHTTYSSAVGIASVLNSTKTTSSVSVSSYGFGTSDYHGLINWRAFGQGAE